MDAFNPTALTQNLVRLAGLEPARLSARDFKSLVSTYFTTGAFVSLCMYYIFFTASCQMNLVLLVRFELTLSATSTLCVYQLRHKSMEEGYRIEL